MTTFNWSDPGSSPVSYLGATLNSLSDGAQVIGAAIDNSAGKMRIRLEVALALQGAARAADAAVEIYAVRSVDGGTTYGYGSATVDPPISALLAVLPFDAATTARTNTIDAEMPAGFVELIFVNETGQALAATGNTLRYVLFDIESN